MLRASLMSTVAAALVAGTASAQTAPSPAAPPTAPSPAAPPTAPPPAATPAPAAPPPAAGPPATQAPAAQAPSTGAQGPAATDPQTAAQQAEEQRAREEQAKAQYTVGKSLYDAGRFSEAADEWMKAYELSPHPDLLYNAYLAYRDAGDTANARDALERYLATAAVPADLRVTLEARLRVLREAAAAEQQAQAAPAEPAPQTEPAPAAHQVQLDTSDGEILPWVLVGLGGAMIVGGTVTGLITLGKVGDIEKECPNDVCPADYDLEAAKDEAGTTALVTDVLLVGGVAAAAVGVVLAIVRGGEESPAAAGDAPLLSCGGSGCTFSTRF